MLALGEVGAGGGVVNLASGASLLVYVLVAGTFHFRRACAERVTVVVSCVCMYVCPNTLFWQYAQLEV